MSVHYLKSGIDSTRARPGLIVLLYFANLAMGLILSIPILIAFSSVLSSSGFSPELAEEFDLSLWADLLRESGPVLQTVFAQMLWLIPVIYVWKIVLSVGLIEAHVNGGGGSFWKGVGRDTGRATILGMVYLVIFVAAVIGVIIVASILSTVLSGEKGTLWVWFIFTPLAIFMAMALIDMMHDFGRLELVVSGKGIMESWFAGMKWPFISGSANSIYLGWMVLGLVALFIPLLLDLRMGGLFLAFLVQQLFLFLRAGVTVGWIASEVHFFEDMRVAMEPTIATDAATEEGTV